MNLFNELPLVQICFYASVMTIVMTTLFFTVSATKQTTERKLCKEAKGKGLNDLEKISIVHEVVIFIVLMFIFVIVLDTIAWLMGIKHVLLISLVHGISWIVIYVSVGWTEVEPQDFQIVEAFGSFKRVIFSGPHILCFPGLIDKPKKFSQSMKKDCLVFFQDESNSGTDNLIDFKDGYSAEVQMTVWYVIENPILWTYRVEDEPTKWLEDQIFRTAQSIMEAKSLDYATHHKLDITQKTLDDDTVPYTGRKALKKYIEDQLGIKITSFIINDIKIPEEIRNIRMEGQRGEADRERRVAEARGYEDAIQAIIEYARSKGRTMSYEQAKKLYDENQNRKVMNGSNITILGKDISDALGNVFSRR